MTTHTLTADPAGAGWLHDLAAVCRDNAESCTGGGLQQVVPCWLLTADRLDGFAARMKTGFTEPRCEWERLFIEGLADARRAPRPTDGTVVVPPALRTPAVEVAGLTSVFDAIALLVAVIAEEHNLTDVQTSMGWVIELQDAAHETFLASMHGRVVTAPPVLQPHVARVHTAVTRR